MAFVQNLKLHNFRCYTQATLRNLSPGLIVLHGPNGAGKTNLLEALSLLAPGRGLRGAKTLEMQRAGKQEPWAISSLIETPHGPVKLGTGIHPETGKRAVRINGHNAHSQSSLAPYFAAVWLTPQMDRLFLDSASHRRRFLDRLIFAFDSGHAGRVSRYENALGQRARLLKEGRADPAWLEALELQMAETGVAIAAARVDFCIRLQEACRCDCESLFPQAHLSVRGTMEEVLSHVPALEAENLFQKQLLQSRSKDAFTGGAAVGPHRSDLCVSYAVKNMPAAQCSTGEQKALLSGIILAHARLIAAERDAPPVLLLDEIAAHLDEGRRAALYDILEEMRGQVWLTGADERLFEAIKGRARFFEIKEAEISDTMLEEA